jgi:response regulator of citrate/malate metabolism
VLIVDDSLFLRIILKDALTRIAGSQHFFVSFREASSNEKAMEELRQGHFDWIFLDIVMTESEREGIEILEFVRRSHLRTRVFVVSAVGQPKLQAECVRLGADEYMLKPFDEKELESVVRRYLE